MTAVELETDRLRLRRWRLSDFDALAEFLADPELSRYRIGPIDRDRAWDFMCGQLGQWQLRGYGILGIAKREDDRPIGYTGLWHPARLDEPELAYSLFRGAHGQGFATEAVARVLRWARDDLGLAPPMSLIHPDNAPSIAVAKRLGAARGAAITFMDQPRIVFRHAFPSA